MLTGVICESGCTKILLSELSQTLSDYEYLPNLNYNGNHVLALTLTDSNNEIVTSTIEVEVVPINDPPDVIYTFQFLENEIIPINQIANGKEFIMINGIDVIESDQYVEKVIFEIDNPTEGDSFFIDLITKQLPVHADYSENFSYKGVDITYEVTVTDEIARVQFNFTPSSLVKEFIGELKYQFNKIEFEELNKTIRFISITDSGSNIEGVNVTEIIQGINFKIVNIEVPDKFTLIQSLDGSYEILTNGHALISYIPVSYGDKLLYDPNIEQLNLSLNSGSTVSIGTDIEVSIEEGILTLGALTVSLEELGANDRVIVTEQETSMLISGTTLQLPSLSEISSSTTLMDISGSIVSVGNTVHDVSAVSISNLDVSNSDFVTLTTVSGGEITMSSSADVTVNKDGMLEVNKNVNHVEIDISSGSLVRSIVITDNLLQVESDKGTVNIPLEDLSEDAIISSNLELTMTNGLKIELENIEGNMDLNNIISSTLIIPSSMNSPIERNLMTNSQLNNQKVIDTNKNIDLSLLENKDSIFLVNSFQILNDITTDIEIKKNIFTSNNINSFNKALFKSIIDQTTKDNVTSFKLLINVAKGLPDDGDFIRALVVYFENGDINFQRLFAEYLYKNNILTVKQWNDLIRKLNPLENSRVLKYINELRDN